MAAVLVYGSRQRFSSSADSSQGGTFEENCARWLAFTVRTFVAKRRRAVKSLVSSRRGTNITAAIFAEGLDAENCLPTEYSGYACAAAAAVAAAAALWSER